jgi:drug/metabolite transporter (DMT)-like permease
MTLPLWVWAALMGAIAQTGRNATQAGLTSALGTVGATQVRFLFGLPFAALFLIIQTTWTGSPIPLPGLTTLGWTALGAWAQIAGTALMLLLMKDQSFGVATAWLKTEPVLVALLGIPMLGDHLTPGTLTAIAIATTGVLILSIKPGPTLGSLFQTRPALLGLLAGLGYGLAAIGFRGGITNLPDGSFLTRALTTLTLALAIQSATLLIWLALFDRKRWPAPSASGAHPSPQASSAPSPRPAGSRASRSPQPPMSAPWHWSRCRWPNSLPACISSRKPPRDSISGWPPS